MDFDSELGAWELKGVVICVLYANFSKRTNEFLDIHLQRGAGCDVK